MIEFNKEIMTEEDLLEAADSIFKSQERDFYKLKNEKWYHTLFRALTLNQDGKKYAVKGICSLAKLQKLFMSIYVNNYRKSHKQLDELIEAINTSSAAIKNLYGACVLKLERQEDLSTLNATDSEILALFLGEYRNEDGEVPEGVRKYNRGVLSALHQKIPNGSLDDHQIRLLDKPRIVYRCFLEQCAVDGTIDTQEWSDKISDHLKDFEISDRSKFEIKESVKREAEIAGSEYFIVKYDKEKYGVVDTDFEIEFSESNPDEEIVSDSDGILTDLNTLKRIKLCGIPNYEVTSGIAHKFFSQLYSKNNPFSFYTRIETHETSRHVIYKNDKRIYKFSKLSGNSKEINMTDLLFHYYGLSNATSGDIIEKYIRDVFDGIKAFGNGFFFSIGAYIFYLELCDDKDNCKLVIDLSKKWHDGDSVKIKGIESNYFIFSYEENIWCLLDLDTGKILIPEPLKNRSDNFIVNDENIYFINATISNYKKNKSIQGQYGVKTSSIQVVQYNLITGISNPSSKEIFWSSGQQDGLGLLVKFDKVGDKYIILRRTHFVSNKGFSTIALLFGTCRGSYLYMVFDSHFNPISGGSFKSIDENSVFDAEYCGNGIVLYEDHSDCLKIISLLNGRTRTIVKGTLSDITKCGDYLSIKGKETVMMQSI